VFLDATRRNLFLNETECVLQIVFLGGEIGSTGLYHTVTADIPNLKIATEAIGEEEEQATYQMNFTEDTVLKAAGEEYFKWTVRTDTNASALLVAA